MFSIDVASILGQNRGIQKRAQRPGGVTPGPKPVLVFASDRDSVGVLGQFDIYMMSADGSGQTRLTLQQGAPTGKKIAFERGRGTDAEIWVMSADGSGQTRLTNNAAYDGNPEFSPDGRRIVFVSDRSDPSGRLFALREIYVMNADGTSAHRLEP